MPTDPTDTSPRLALGLLSAKPGAPKRRHIAPPRLISVRLADWLASLRYRRKPMAKLGETSARAR